MKLIWAAFLTITVLLVLLFFWGGSDGETSHRDSAIGKGKESKSTREVTEKKNHRKEFSIAQSEVEKRYLDFSYSFRNERASEELVRLREEFIAGKCADSDVRMFFSMWSSRNLEKALEVAIEERNSRFNLAALEGVFSEIDEEDLEKAHLMLSEIPTTRNVEVASRGLLKKLVNNDPLAFFEFFSRTSESWLKQNALTVFGLSIGVTNPREGARMIGELDSGMQEKVMSNLIAGWAVSDPEAAAQYIETGGLKFDAKDALLSSWIQTEPNSAMRWLLENTEGKEKERLAERSILNMQMGAFTGEEILEVIGGIPEGKTKDSAVEMMLYNWTGGDFRSIAEVAYAEGVSASGNPAEARFAERWVAESLLEAENFWINNQGNPRIKFLRNEIIKEKISREPSRAVEMIDEIKGVKSHALVEDVYRGLIESDGSSAENFMSNLQDVPSFENHLGEFGRYYGEVKPEAAVNWAIGYSGDADWSPSLDSVFTGWVARDEYAAGTYIKNMANVERRDLATNVLIQSLVTTDAESAIEWANSVNGIEERRKAFLSLKEGMDFNNRSEYLLFVESELKDLESE